MSQTMTPSAAASTPAKKVSWFKDPWRTPRVLASFTWAYLAWSIVPVFVAILFSFNDGRSRSVWQGFSTGWYCGNAPVPETLSLCQRPELIAALKHTILLAVLTTLIATPIGVMFAIGLDRWHSRTARTANFAMLLSFVTPELIIGIALFMTFTQLFVSGQSASNPMLKNPIIPLGTWAQVLGLVTFQLSYPVIICRARLSSIGKEYEEAAMDLGARPAQALRKVLLPLLYPAIFASGIIIFADMIDDFVTVRALCRSAACETISVKIYGGYRSAATPALNAMATLMLVGTLLAITLGAVVYRVLARKQQGQSADTVRDFALQI